MLKLVLALFCLFAQVAALSVIETPQVASAEVRFYDHRPPGGPIDLAWDTEAGRRADHFAQKSPEALKPTKHFVSMSAEAMASTPAEQKLQDLKAEVELIESLKEEK